MTNKIEKLQIKDFDYQLPHELIAQKPINNRENSKMLFLNESGKLQDKLFSDIESLISKNDLIIFNNTKVIKARLFGYKETGGKIEILIERVISKNIALSHIKSNKSIKMGIKIYLSNNITLTVHKKIDDLFETHFSNNVMKIIDQYGKLPLPPYIKKEPDEIDEMRYQTVYAKKLGSIAAPTAGLHFSKQIIKNIIEKGAKIEYLTLHVGSGTFKPVKTKNIDDHVMHSEYFDIPYSTIKNIINTKKANGKIIAVGTTTLRALESASDQIEKFNFNLTNINGIKDQTNIFIRPGYKFKIVDSLITNFHLPKSTLIMLVSALAGYEPIYKAYEHAISMKYRFFSYGDAMFIEAPKHD